MIRLPQNWSLRVVLILCVALVGFILNSSGVGAAQKDTGSKKTSADKEKKAITLKAEKHSSAASEDFGEALGLHLASLATLGARIDAARAALDPVGLVLAAKELAAAEAVSKKQAGVKADALLKEGVDIAKARNRPDELRVVAALVSSEDTKKELLAQAEKAESDLASRKSGETTRGIEENLYVDNKTDLFVEIYVNYSSVGTLAPHAVGHIYVGQSPLYATTLFAKAPYTSYTFGPRVVDYRITDYLWTLTR